MGRVVAFGDAKAASSSVAPRAAYIVRRCRSSASTAPVTFRNPSSEAKADAAFMTRLPRPRRRSRGATQSVAT